jgi:hypothetical protein
VVTGDAPATATTDGFTLTACGAGGRHRCRARAALTLAPGTWTPSQVGFSVTMTPAASR